MEDIANFMRKLKITLNGINGDKPQYRRMLLRIKRKMETTELEFPTGFLETREPNWLREEPVRRIFHDLDPTIIDCAYVTLSEKYFAYFNMLTIPSLYDVINYDAKCKLDKIEERIIRACLPLHLLDGEDCRVESDIDDVMHYYRIRLGIAAEGSESETWRRESVERPWPRPWDASFIYAKRNYFMRTDGFPPEKPMDWSKFPPMMSKEEFERQKGVTKEEAQTMAIARIRRKRFHPELAY